MNNLPSNGTQMGGSYGATNFERRSAFTLIISFLYYHFGAGRRASIPVQLQAPLVSCHAAAGADPSSGSFCCMGLTGYVGLIRH